MSAATFAIRSADRREVRVYSDAGERVGCAVGDVPESTLRGTWPTLGEIVELQDEPEGDLPMASRGRPVCPTCASPQRCRQPGTICGLYCIPVKDLTPEHVQPREPDTGEPDGFLADFEEDDEPAKARQGWMIATRACMEAWPGKWQLNENRLVRRDGKHACVVDLCGDLAFVGLAAYPLPVLLVPATGKAENVLRCEIVHRDVPGFGEAVRDLVHRLRHLDAPSLRTKRSKASS